MAAANMLTEMVFPNLKKRARSGQGPSHRYSPERGMQPPLDTLGNPMPPPAPSIFVCRLPASEWGEYWARSPDGTAPMPYRSFTTGAKFETSYADNPASWDFEPPTCAASTRAPPATDGPSR